MSFQHNNTVSKSEPDWGSVNKVSLPRAAFADEGDAAKKSSWSYPHHWLQDGGSPDAMGCDTTGTMYLHDGGLNAAWAAAQGAHTGQKASAEVIAHLAAHRKAVAKPQTFNVHLVALTPAKMPWLAGDQFPRELKLLDFGVNSTRKGPVRVGEKTRTKLMALQAERGFDRVALDFEHNTLPGTKAYKESSEPREVAAYGAPQLRPDGLYLVDIEPTPAGRAKARNYIDISPAPELDDNNEVLFLHSVALCRQGAVDGLDLDKAACFSVQIPGDNAGQNTQEENALMDKILTALRKGLGLADTATESDIQTALTGLKTGMASFAEKITTLTAKLGEIEKTITALSAAGATDKKAEEFAAKITALTAKVEDAATKIIHFEAEIGKRDRAELVAQACREGKVLPLNAEQIAATPVAVLKDMVKNLAVTVPLEKRTPPNVQEFSVSADQTLSEQDKTVAKKLGFTEEEVKKANSLK